MVAQASSLYQDEDGVVCGLDHALAAKPSVSISYGLGAYCHYDGTSLLRSMRVKAACPSATDLGISKTKV
jgi:hypothetical protein